MEKKVKKFSFGEVYIEDQIVIAEMKEGIVFSQEYNMQFLEYCNAQFKGKPYAYISYRTNSYTIDPNVYTYTAKFSTMEAIAVVSNDPQKRIHFSFEKQFFNHPFEEFDTLESAKNWIKAVLVI